MTMIRRNYITSGVRYALKEFGRHHFFIALALVLPFLFVQVTFLASPETEIPMRTTLYGFTVTKLYDMPHIHGTVMAPITGAFVAGMTGVMMSRSATGSDQRLVLAGFRPTEAVLMRLLVVGLVSIGITVVISGILYANYPYAAPIGVSISVLLVTLTYGCIGISVGTFLDRTGSLYVMLFLPMLDIGILNDPIFFRGEPAWWMKPFPSHFSMQLLWDTGFTVTFDTLYEAIPAIGYLLLLIGVAVYLLSARLE